MNAVFKVSNASASNAPMAILVRVFTDKTDILTDPKTVVQCMRVAQKAGLGATVLAAFANGIVYIFQEGEMIDPDDERYNKPYIRR